MAQPRLELQDLLESFTANVYFQPPPNVAMKYPCIVYSLDDDVTRHANNALYNRMKRYQATYITQNPDDPVSDVLAELPLCAFQRRFVTANLTHDVFNLFF